MDGTEPERLLSGRYRLTAVIGRGGMGVVWQGHDELLDRDVAVKEVIWPPHLTEPEQQLACRRAVREAQVAGRLSHHNVVRIYDIVESGGHPCIVMEFLPYRSLRDLVADEGPLPPARAAEVGLGVLAALRAAHAEGILHRDVKPANVLVGPDGRVVLTDFGIARAADSPTLTGTGAVLGSPSYIAPERARGGRAGAATVTGDLWGLGASLYAAVEGHPPFERGSALATLTAVVTEQPEEAVHAGPLAPVISGLLRKEPAERLDADATEWLLRQVAADSGPDLAAPAPDGERAPGAAREPDVTTAPGPRARPRRPRGGLAALAALIVVAAGITGVAFYLTSPSGRSASAAGSPSPAASRGTSARPTTAASSSPGTGSPAASATGAPATATSPSGGTGSAPAAGSSGALPAGYRRYTDSTGFSIGVPDGWTITHQGHYASISDPADGNVYLLIDQSDQPKSDPLADWKQQQANREGTYQDYRLIRLESVPYPQAEKAADWEFTYVKSGVPLHVLNRNVLANADHAYALYWSTPASDWTADYRYFQAFAATFRPAP